MKRVVFLIVLWMLSMQMYGQFRFKDRTENLIGFDEQQFSWGFYVGANLFDFKLHPNENGLNEDKLFYVESEPQMGFHAGLITRWRLNQNFDFRVEPGMYFLQRELTFHHIKALIGTTDPVSGHTFVAADTVRTVKSTYLDVPLMLNLHGDRWYNTRPYMSAGIGWMVNLQSNEKKLDDNINEVFRTKTHNFNWQFELGVEVYFSRFKLTPSVKGIFMFNNEWFPDNPGTPDVWAGSLTALNTRAIVFSLKFE